MRRGIHRLAATGLAGVGVLLLGTGLATAGQAAATAAPGPTGQPTAVGTATDGQHASGCTSPERAGTPMLRPIAPEADVQRDRISPHLQPRAVNSLPQADHHREHAERPAGEAGQRAGEVTQRHPICVDDARPGRVRA